MVRVKKANGAWEDLTSPTEPPAPFQGGDGTRMTSEEIAKAAKADSIGLPAITHSAFAHDRAQVRAQAEKEAAKRSEIAASRPVNAKGHKMPSIDADRVWQLIGADDGPHMTQTAAMRELGCSQGGIQSALRRYMRNNGIVGPLPGGGPRSKAAQAVPAPDDQLLARVRPFQERRMRAIEPTEDDWQEQQRRRYIEALIDRACHENSLVLFDRIERLLGLAAA